VGEEAKLSLMRDETELKEAHFSGDTKKGTRRNVQKNLKNSHGSFLGERRTSKDSSWRSPEGEGLQQQPTPQLLRREKRPALSLLPGVFTEERTRRSSARGCTGGHSKKRENGQKKKFSEMGIQNEPSGQTPTRSRRGKKIPSRPSQMFIAKGVPEET